MKYILLFLLFSYGAIGVALPGTPFAISDAAAYGASHETTPLMIIRFNQRKVYFERQLYNAVARAVQAKPEVMFDVVAIAPRGRGQEAFQRNSQASENNLGKVVAYLNRMGVPNSRMSVTRQASDTADSSEVHIFVR